MFALSLGCLRQSLFLSYVQRGALVALDHLDHEPVAVLRDLVLQGTRRLTGSAATVPASTTTFPLCQ